MPRSKKVSPIKTKIGKWQIVVDEYDGRLPSDFIMLKYGGEIYTFPTANDAKIVFDGVDPYDDETDPAKRDITVDVRGNGFHFHTMSSGIVNLTYEKDASTVFFIKVPVKVVQSLQALIRQKYGEVATNYGGAKRRRVGRSQRSQRSRRTNRKRSASK